MSVEKSELKMLVAHELGVSFDDSLESAQADKLRSEGAKKALGEVARAVEMLLDHVAKDFKEEKISKEQADTATLYVRRAADVARNLRVRAEAVEHQHAGRVAAFQTVVTITKKLHDSEQAKAVAIKEHAANGNGNGNRPAARPAGVRPVNRIANLKARAPKPKKKKKATKKKAKAKKKTKKKA